MNVLETSYAVGAAHPALIEQTIGRCFEETVARFPDREAVVSCHQGLRYSYRQLDREVGRLASALLRLGLRTGERVGIWSHNNMEWLLIQLATARIGIVLVNINPAYRASELDYALNKVGCRMLITMTSFKTTEYIEIVRELAPGLAHAVPGALDAPRLPQLRWLVHLGNEPIAGVMCFSELMALGDPDDPAVRAAGESLKATDPINIQFTSGTTGFPKGATLSHRNILNNGFFVGEAMRFTERDRLCVPVPLYHCFGMVMGNLNCLTHGATIVYPGESFDPVSVLTAVQDERCTALYGVPTMFIAMLSHPRFAEFDLNSLRTGCMAGSPCPIEVMKRVVDDMHMKEVTIAYGMTETSPVSCQSTVDTPLERRVGTVGQVHPHLEIKLVDPDTGRTVGIGETGELCTRGYSVMNGYWNDENRTREAIDEDEWMHTGDLATMDAKGYVNIVGRIKDMVIRGGENVYPREIEEFLYGHPAIRDVQVVGVPDPKYGEELCAWVVLRPDHTLTEEELRAHCKGQIAHYKVPRYVRFVDEFPMTITGKIQKYRIREIMQHELGLMTGQTA
ncbi:AMP-binding protein [Burkholderia multivorans]|uniref:AMP-binding protein n=1 Tax=Burkholderia multivorans TaxID=87883 RepID=A0AAP2HRE5_9BURK|nr:AMP-binding protein [Burkholderia multivorans]MBU9360461.1 AMP-binding protein [Burkholderia multivorans]HDR9017787.1 AMP-binding protein [Burkholderia vietnamiensis]